MELLYKILETVNGDENLNSSNVVEKIKEEFERNLGELYLKYDTHGHEYESCNKEYKKWKKSGFSLNHDFNESGILLRVAAKMVI